MVDNYSFIVIVEPDSTAAPALVQEKPRKGIDRLFKDDKKEKDEGGRVTVEE
ncbi:MAG: hypothetical protein IPM12_02685 [Flavobacteriales bacterium]|nr:hypothetical protein [Flavobacteriales bacterium]